MSEFATETTGDEFTDDGAFPVEADAPASTYAEVTERVLERHADTAEAPDPWLEGYEAALAGEETALEEQFAPLDTFDERVAKGLDPLQAVTDIMGDARFSVEERLDALPDEARTRIEEQLQSHTMERLTNPEAIAESIASLPEEEWPAALEQASTALGHIYEQQAREEALQRRDGLDYAAVVQAQAAETVLHERELERNITEAESYITETDPDLDPDLVGALGLRLLDVGVEDRQAAMQAATQLLVSPAGQQAREAETAIRAIDEKPNKNYSDVTEKFRLREVQERALAEMERQIGLQGDESALNADGTFKPTGNANPGDTYEDATYRVMVKHGVADPRADRARGRDELGRFTKRRA